jgi:FkbM family methyltransferase
MNPQHQTWALPETDTYFHPILQEDPRGFQIDHLDAALRHCTQFRTAVDGGAHVGTWTVAMAARFHRVAAFEPAGDTFDCLQANTQGLANIVLYRCALGATRGRGEIVDDGARRGNTGSRYLQITTDGSVEVLPLDFLQLRDLDFLKLDVEGHELQALQGARATLKRCRPVVLIEVKPLRVGHDPMLAVRWIEDFGYREVSRVGRDRIYVSAV